MRYSLLEQCPLLFIHVYIKHSHVRPGILKLIFPSNNFPEPLDFIGKKKIVKRISRLKSWKGQNLVITTLVTLLSNTF